MHLLYIDPGTGSMIFSLAIGLLSVAWFGLRKIYMKLKYLSPGKETTGEKVIPLVIFSDDKRYWQTFEPICRELDRRGFEMSYLTMSAKRRCCLPPHPASKHISGNGQRMSGFMSIFPTAPMTPPPATAASVWTIMTQS